MMMIVAIGDWAAGTLGAVVVLLAFFGPTAVLAFLVGRLWIKLAKWPWRDSIQKGLAPVSIGLLLAGCFTLAKGAVTGATTAAIAFLVFVILLRVKINPALLVLGGAVVGAFAYGPKIF
jgi:chromate transporter